MAPHDMLMTFLCSYEEGRALLSHGEYEWKIPTRRPPVTVLVGEISSPGVPVCGGGVNRFGTKILPDGFVLYATVESEAAEILWQAELDKAA